MGLENIATIVENHGLSFVISCMVLYRINKLAQLWINNLENKIVKNHSQKLKDNWPKTIQKNGTTHQLLYKLLYKYNADRVYVFEYHNGGHSISGIDFLKSSNTYEVCNEGIKSEQKMLQNLPIGVFALWNQQILKKNFVCFENIEDLKRIDLGMYQVLKTQNIKSIFVIGLYDAQGNPIGYMGVEFVNNHTICNEDMKHDLEQVSYRIAGLLY